MVVVVVPFTVVTRRTSRITEVTGRSRKILPEPGYFCAFLPSDSKVAAFFRRYDERSRINAEAEKVSHKSLRLPRATFSRVNTIINRTHANGSGSWPLAPVRRRLSWFPARHRLIGLVRASDGCFVLPPAMVRKAAWRD